MLSREDGAGKRTIPAEHSRRGGTIRAKRTAEADHLSPMAKRELGIVGAKSRVQPNRCEFDLHHGYDEGPPYDDDL